MSYEGVFGEIAETASFTRGFLGQPYAAKKSMPRRMRKPAAPSTYQGSISSGAVKPPMKQYRGGRNLNIAPAIAPSPSDSIGYSASTPAKSIVPKSEEKSGANKKDKSKEESKQSIDDAITFAAGKATLSKQVKSILDKHAKQICQNIASIKTITITGHADSGQLDDFKQKLSLERAIAVKDYVVSQCAAISGFYRSGNLKIRGEADRKPVASNKTETGRAQNRRVEIKIKM